MLRRIGGEQVPTSGHDTIAEAKEMVLLGKNFHHSSVFATEFLINGTTLRFVSADGNKTLHMHGYHRDRPYSWNGRKLIPERLNILRKVDFLFVGAPSMWDVQ